MDASFWHQKWQRGDIGFHLSEANPLLVANFDRLNLTPGARVFLPLCGKTKDLAWFLARGFRVAGAELSEQAITELFDELGVAPTRRREGELMQYSAEAIDIFVGDVFALTPEQLGSVDAVYDRAALVALPPAMRDRYSAHLMHLSCSAPQLLITFEYEQSLIDGPPFSIGVDEVTRQYATAYQLHLLESRELAGGLKGRVPCVEQVWWLE